MEAWYRLGWWRPFTAAETIEVLGDADAVASRAAEIVQSEVASRGHTRIVLAGGTTPRRCYEVLASRPVAWGRVAILFGDERCVPPQHAESNFLMASDALLRRSAPATVHRIPAELGPAVAAQLYEPIVAQGPLDLVLLGLGSDGHTASLFPDNPALAARSLVTAVYDAPKPPGERVSLTLRALRAAKRVGFLVTGEDKADALRRALEGTVPAGLIPHAEWIADASATSRLDGRKR